MGRVLRDTRPRRLLYTADRGGRASPPPPGARGPVETLVLRVSASPPPRLSLLGATGWPRPPIQPRRQRRRRRRQRQQVRVGTRRLRGLRGVRRGSATGRWRGQAGSPARACALRGRSRKVRGSALPTLVARGPALGAQAPGGPYTDTHPGCGTAKSGGQGAASLEDRKADCPAAKHLSCGCEKRGSGGPAGDCD